MYRLPGCVRGDECVQQLPGGTRELFRSLGERSCCGRAARFGIGAFHPVRDFLPFRGEGASLLQYGLSGGRVFRISGQIFPVQIGIESGEMYCLRSLRKDMQSAVHRLPQKESGFLALCALPGLREYLPQERGAFHMEIPFR